MRLPAGQSPGLRHRRAPGHASSHGEEPDDGSYRSSGQVLITRAAAAVARRRDPTNLAPAQPPGVGGAGAGGAPQDWGRGARSRDTVRLRAPWPPLGKRSLIESSASSYPKRTEIYRDLGLSNIRASYRVRAAGPSATSEPARRPERTQPSWEGRTRKHTALLGKACGSSRAER
jgi:hypothetical protein